MASGLAGSKIAIYARISTAEQSVENQLLVLERLCQQRGWQVSQTYQEQESAWKAGHQVELKRLLEDAAKRKFDMVIIWSLDRLSREGPLAILQIIDRFKRYGVRIISYQEPWTEAPGELADLLYAISGWVARMESQRRSERTKAGLERAKKSGGGKRGLDKKKRKRRWKKRPPKMG